MFEGVLTHESFAWLVGSLCRLSRVPFDTTLLLQRYPAPHSLPHLRDALQSLGFRIGDGALARASFPCIGFLKGGEPALLLKADRERILYFKAGSQAAEGGIAAHFEPEGFEKRLAAYFGVDSITYLSREGLAAVSGSEVCAACFTGAYPVPVSDEERGFILAQRRSA